MKVFECTKRPILSPCELPYFDFQVEPYIGCEHYCYYCYILPQAETNWSKKILIHRDIVNQLEEELENISPQAIYLGYYTDPFQPIEAKYYRTRNVLELLAQKGFSVGILTKLDFFYWESLHFGLWQFILRRNNNSKGLCIPKQVVEKRNQNLFGFL